MAGAPLEVMVNLIDAGGFSAIKAARPDKPIQRLEPTRVLIYRGELGVEVYLDADIVKPSGKLVREGGTMAKRPGEELTKDAVAYVAGTLWSMATGPLTFTGDESARDIPSKIQKAYDSLQPSSQA
ncbi:hypothetical protein HYU16_01365 [Candidatus Woesearchaeota archaeon]|nr:hypothetical protein [Candidatus Woesearchaeota archaeon]